MRLLSLSEASIQPRTSRLKLPNSEKCHLLLRRLAAARAAEACGRRGQCPRLPAEVLPTWDHIHVRKGYLGAAFAALTDLWQILANFGRFWQMLANFARLVLGCIDVSDSESRRIFSGFSSIYTICILLHRSKLKIFAKIRDFAEICANFCKNRCNSAKFGKFR